MSSVYLMLADFLASNSPRNHPKADSRSRQNREKLKLTNKNGDLQWPIIQAQIAKQP